MADNLTYCLCGQPYDANKFMIECDVCKEWFHGSCVGVLELTSIDIDKFHCPRCEPLCGPSIFKVLTNLHRHNPYDIGAENKPVQTGTKIFIDELKTRTFSSGDEVVRTVRGQQISLQYLIQNGFNEPVLVEHKEGLGLRVPAEHFSLVDVENNVGPEKDIDVINVTSQTDHKMKLHDFVEYYQSSNRDKVLNCISLEFSDTQLNKLVEAPYIARKLDWADTVWPRNPPPEYTKPAVQKYCLMGVENSYTDFHIDFGGTSVWYHVLRGEKIFYLIPPTPANLSLYQRWSTSSSQNETFFADQVDRCYKCVVRQGYTLLMPTGWIHAVLTPKDSLVFGGNFLHSLNIPMQLQVYDIEKKTNLPSKFCYPQFETINWFAAVKLLQDLKEYNSKCAKCPQMLLQGVKSLVATLKLWSQDRDTNKTRREDIPSTIESQKVLKDLSKEIRHAERYINSLNPPKPERESKRKKKKPIDKDFVDITQPHSLQNLQEEKAPVKLNIKNINKKIQQSSLKVTISKPVDYLQSLPPVPEPPVNVKSEHVNGRDTVLRFKLGKPVAPKDSVYDFHDSDEDHLLIDERPKKLRHVNTEKKAQNVYLLNGKCTGGADPLGDMDVAGEVDVVSDVPKNGIEELLKASSLENQETSTGEEKVRKKSHISHLPGVAGSHNDESDPASPSTQEAIAGMLSISRSYMTDHQNAKSLAARQRRKRARVPDTEEEEDVEGDPEEDQMAKVHQDDDYVYPTLDASDDEDFIFKPRGRRKMDEAWNPKARVGPVVPKTDRPIREGTKKQSVEKGLEAAAAKRAGLPAPKRPYHRKKPRVVPEAAQNTATAAPSATVTVSAPNTATNSSASALPTKKLELKNRKPKKGMATAKQRLGKILKIHKMVF